MALLQAQKLCLSLNGRKLLDEVSLSLPEGKITVLLGPNGAGKSTLMRMLSGYLPAESGECLLQNKPLSAYSHRELAKQRAVMRQHSLLNFPFLVEEVIQMGGYHRRKAEVAAIIDQVIELTDCQNLRHKPYRALSGGEQQRVQLARALLQLWDNNMHGKLLFLDEPTSAFDLYHQQHCLRLMTKLAHEHGLTVCCILHDLNLSALYGDQLILLADGKIQCQGQPNEVLTQETIHKWYGAEVVTLPHHASNVPQVQFSR